MFERTNKKPIELPALEPKSDKKATANDYLEQYRKFVDILIDKEEWKTEFSRVMDSIDNLAGEITGEGKMDDEKKDDLGIKIEPSEQKVGQMEQEYSMPSAATESDPLLVVGKNKEAPFVPLVEPDSKTGTSAVPERVKDNSVPVSADKFVPPISVSQPVNKKPETVPVSDESEPVVAPDISKPQVAKTIRLCLKCKAKNDINANFCSSCGHKKMVSIRKVGKIVTYECIKCGEWNPTDGSKIFCSGCGSKISDDVAVLLEIKEPKLKKQIDQKEKKEKQPLIFLSLAELYKAIRVWFIVVIVLIVGMWAHMFYLLRGRADQPAKVEVADLQSFITGPMPSLNISPAIPIGQDMSITDAKKKDIKPELVEVVVQEKPEKKKVEIKKKLKVSKQVKPVEQPVVEVKPKGKKEEKKSLTEGFPSLTPSTPPVVVQPTKGQLPPMGFPEPIAAVPAAKIDAKPAEVSILDQLGGSSSQQVIFKSVVKVSYDDAEISADGKTFSIPVTLNTTDEKTYKVKGGIVKLQCFDNNNKVISRGVITVDSISSKPAQYLATMPYSEGVSDIDADAEIYQ